MAMMCDLIGWKIFSWNILMTGKTMLQTVREFYSKCQKKYVLSWQIFEGIEITVHSFIEATRYLLQNGMALRLQGIYYNMVWLLCRVKYGMAFVLSE